MIVKYNRNMCVFFATVEKNMQKPIRIFAKALILGLIDAFFVKMIRKYLTTVICGVIFYDTQF